MIKCLRTPQIKYISNKIKCIENEYMDHGEVEWVLDNNKDYIFQNYHNENIIENKRENKRKNIIENKRENIIENKRENIIENKRENIIENKELKVENIDREFINLLINKIYKLINTQYLNLDTFISEFSNMLHDDFVKGNLSSNHIYMVIILVINYKKNIIDKKEIDKKEIDKKEIDKKVKKIKNNFSVILMVLTVIFTKNVNIAE